MKTVRFSQVVERSGHPHVHALWVAPERDPEFVRARKADRVMTIAPRGHGKADIGIIGFDAERRRGGQILVFPKSLKPFDGREVVGVKFDLVEQAATEHVTAPQDWKPAAGKTQRAKPATATAEQDGRTSEARPRPRTGTPAAKPRHQAPPGRKPRHTGSRAAGNDGGALLHEVHVALKELRAGKAVAAYQRLERAAADAERAG